MSRGSMVNVEVPEGVVAWLLADGSIEQLEDGTYRMTAKGAGWFEAWLKDRLGGRA